LIYTADHLIDAKLIKQPASTLRHRFHQRNFKTILCFLIGAIIITIGLLFFIKASIFFWGLYLSGFVIIYFVIQRKLGVMKEVLGATLYSIGVMVPVIAISNQSLRSLVSIPAILFFITALINLILFSWFDVENDLNDKQLSIATILGDSATAKLLGFLFFAQLCLLVYAFSLGYNSSYLVVFALMLAILFSLFIKSNWFAIADKYRIMGDAVFLIPLLYLVL
jgi:4-hydroxybenzoate polyprenyltransferase